ncbi:hypothetical protein NIES4075_68220 [Tolypothrix sp. NIES-4075]|uniref:hypothetical protein n=1 Tax=Tolypothrix sp. NIES-4075 TaxID=2005459 RepID=UPI000B5D01FD|nr:hypothetical protein [Tolypothrix sp. NIES-4075]GAX45801.1 hypothetical protein NIES4075_68220 [Tolypothrix sp. NIES-4075]
MSKESKVSKFKGLLDAVKTHEPEPEQEPHTRDEANHKSPAAEPQPYPLPPTPEPEAEPKRGRPKGKRSHPDYEQVTAYIKTLTYQEVKIALLREGQKREFSELMQELLDDWLKSRT